MTDDPLEEYVLRFFGERWDAPMLDEGPSEQVALPAEPCIMCDEEFAEGDRGYYYYSGQPVHRECGFRSVMGGINHLKGTCSCQGGPDAPDPEGVSKREAAQLAWDFVMEGQGR